MRRETRRYGKTVTILEGFSSDESAAEVARELKRRLGAGGSVKDGRVELQGDHIGALPALLSAFGLRVD